MIKHNSNNERIKYKYLRFLRESKGKDESSLDSVAMAMCRFESYTNHRDFKKFHPEQAIGFKSDLMKQKGKQSGKKLSKSTLHTILNHLKGFFQWLSMQPGFKASIIYTEADYFNLTLKDACIAKTSHPRPVPTMEQIKHVINVMPSKTDIERRDQALIAFTLLTGARDSAIASLKLKHVDLQNHCIYQDGRDVKTKFSKSFDTFFFPVGDEISNIVTDWINYLQTKLLWGNDDPVFPKTKMEVDKNHKFKASGLLNEHWSTAGPIRNIFKKAFVLADTPYFNPHSFRKTLTRLALEICRTPEEFKAWSQNYGHADALTTLISYGEITVEKQSELIKGLSTAHYSERSKEEEKLIAAVLNVTRQGNSNP